MTRTAPAGATAAMRVAAASHSVFASAGWRLLLLTGGWAAVILLAVWIYGPALRVPVSVREDGPFLRGQIEFYDTLATRGWRTALREDFTMASGEGNPVYSVVRYMAIRWWEGSPFALHALRLFEWVVWIGAVAWGASLVCRTRRASAVAALFAAAVLVVAEIPGADALEGLRANWYRLHTPEGSAAPWLALYLACVVWALRSPGLLAGSLGPAAASCLAIAAMMKPACLLLILPVISVWLALLVRRDPRARDLLYCIGSFAVFAGLWLAALAYLGMMEKLVIVRSLAVGREGLRDHGAEAAAVMLATLGPLAAAWLPLWWKWTRTAASGTKEEEQLEMKSGSVGWFLGLHVLLGAALFCASKTYEPGQLLLPLTPFVLLMAGATADLLEEARGEPAGLWRTACGAVGALASLLLAPFAWLALYLAAALGAHWRRRTEAARAFAIGGAAAGLAWLFAVGLTTREALLIRHIDDGRALVQLVTLMRTETSRGTPFAYWHTITDPQADELTYFVRLEGGGTLRDESFRRTSHPRRAAPAELMIVREESGTAAARALIQRARRGAMLVIGRYGRAHDVRQFPPFAEFQNALRTGRWDLLRPDVRVGDEWYVLG